MYTHRHTHVHISISIIIIIIIIIIVGGRRDSELWPEAECEYYNMPILYEYQINTNINTNTSTSTNTQGTLKSQGRKPEIVPRALVLSSACGQRTS